MNNRSITYTSDGSTSLSLEGTQECYHSAAGALSESLHVYIKNGLEFFLDKAFERGDEIKKVTILEAGLGTALNALLAFNLARQYSNTEFYYLSIEKFPLSKEEYSKLNHPSVLIQKEECNLDKIEAIELFKQLHECEWGDWHKLGANFNFRKLEESFENLFPFADKIIDTAGSKIDVVFYDAFSFGLQPELWSNEIFQGISNAMNSNGTLVTYACRGVIKENLRNAGLKVNRVAGFGDKHHMTRAIR